jgi:putative toxin-antitoxin system antitoxin component (TIGR02293 family)
VAAHTARKSSAAGRPAPRRGKVYYSDWDLKTAADRVAEGLPTEILGHVQERLDLSQKGLSQLLGISESTVLRSRGAGRLSTGVSERALRIARLAEYAARVLGGPGQAAAWMKEPNFALGDVTPLELARTEPGARLVERTLHDVEHGMPV